MDLVDLSPYPGGELIRQGLDHLAQGLESEAAFLVQIGAPRLRRLGINVREFQGEPPEHKLYELLSASDPDSAHSRYNALIRRLVSFERAVECVG
jgi:hypothetical protein